MRLVVLLIDACSFDKFFKHRDNLNLLIIVTTVIQVVFSYVCILLHLFLHSYLMSCC